MRRFAVIRIKAKFFDKTYLQDILPNHGDYGIFARDPAAKDFLTSQVGIAAGLNIQHIFGEARNETDCREVISRYTRCGGDGGATEKYVRMACGLPKRPQTKTGLIAKIYRNL